MATTFFCANCGAENHPDETYCHACQQLLDQPASRTIGGELLQERYQILNQIGSGGFGAVYQARDIQEHDRLVAIKQINLQGLSSQEIIEATDAFNREAEILSTLRHPLLPRIFDRFSDAHHWYLVMTLIDGQTLDEYVQQQSVKALPAHAGLSLRETLEIGLHLCDALDYLHSQQPPVIFRDLKPGNIMRTDKGQLYLIDFGIARRFKPGQAKDTMPFGSPGFAAPEQYGRAQTTPRADLYSLGALLYCLISGDDPSEHPFQFPSLRLSNAAGTRELDALIQRLVALDPQRRAADVREVQKELEHIQRLVTQANQQIHIWVPPKGQTPPPFPAIGGKQQQVLLNQSGNKLKQRKTTRRRVLTVSLIIGGLLATSQAIYSLIGSQQPIPPSTTGQNVENPDYQTTTDQTPAVPLNGPTFWSPDLSHAAITNLVKNQIEIYRVNDQQLLQTIKAPANFASATINPTVQWSANNNRISTQLSNGMIYAWNVRNRQLVFTFASAMSAYSASSPTIIAWSPDGQYCAMGYPSNSATDDKANYINTALSIIQASNGKPCFQTSFAAYNNGGSDILVWSPTSRYLAFPASFGSANGTSWTGNIWDRETRQLLNPFSGLVTPDMDNSTIAAIIWSPGGERLATLTSSALWINEFNRSQPTKAFSKDFSGGYTSTYGLWSPNGNYLVTLLNQTTLNICDISSRQVTQLNTYDSPNNLVTFTWSADSKNITAVTNSNILSSWPVTQDLFQTN